MIENIIQAMKYYYSIYATIRVRSRQQNFKKLATTFKIDIELHINTRKVTNIYWFIAKGNQKMHFLIENFKFPTPTSKIIYLSFDNANEKKQSFPYKTSMYTIQLQNEKIINLLVLG